MFTTKATKVIRLFMAISVVSSMGLTHAWAAPSKALTSSGAISKIASYTSGDPNEDDGVAEIIKYNSDTQQFYLVNGQSQRIDINTQHKLLAIAVQAEKYSDNGVILLLDYEGKYIAHSEAGVQPDMITFSADGKYILSANEGEPREEYVNRR